MWPLSEISHYPVGRIPYDVEILVTSTACEFYINVIRIAVVFLIGSIWSGVCFFLIFTHCSVFHLWYLPLIIDTLATLEVHRSHFRSHRSVCDMDSGEPREPRIGLGRDTCTWRDNVEGRKVPSQGHVRTCPTLDILKATKQGAAPVRCGFRLAFTRWGEHLRNLALNLTLCRCLY